MSQIINEILSKEPFNTHLINYKLINIDNFNNIKPGSHIKYITLNEELKTGGSLISCNYNGKWRKSYLLIMSGSPWKLKFQSNWIFYKDPPINFKKLMILINEGKINPFITPNEKIKDLKNKYIV